MDSDSEDGRIEEENRKLLVDGDDTIVECRDHHFTCRFGDLDDIGQMALLNGIDVKGEKCILSQHQRK